ncbi:hypothetical protein RI129_001128 [Pyrocoelia pectoralis]|uniref:G-protein coupled receptors family 2 profile 2 domain-containing protein n=1 Tax=Pyrocoelia pectoralis TaxID=417401 RepID=A0AAN7VUT9_9COLE
MKHIVHIIEFLVLSFLPTTVWAIIVAIQNNQLCWVADSDWHQWIPDGFRIAILSTNMLLLADIIRVLLMKLRRNVNPQHTKSTLKAMSFLIPLFGIPFILTASRNMIDNSSCRAGDVYYYITYIIQSFQSVMVAILFCYCNKEVQQQIKRTYEMMAIMCNERFPSTKRKSESCRRDTAATYIQNQLGSQHEQNITNPTLDVNLKVDTWVTENNLQENSVNFGVVHELINNSSEHSDTLSLKVLHQL